MERTITDARAACDANRWGDAWRLLSAEAVDDLDIDDLDRLATAAYLTGRDDAGFAQWIRAHQMCVDEGTIHRAAYFGMKLAQGFGFKGDLARCRGWVDRTARLLEDAGIDCVEQGYLQHAVAMCRIFETGDIVGARADFAQAAKIGARFSDRELLTLCRLGEGRMLIYLGEITDGMALLDEVTVSIEAGDLSPLATGDAYCTVIDACSELFDVVRCRAWTESFSRWCDSQQELVLYRGHCFIHRAEVLGLLGDWREGLTEARRACDRLAEPVNLGALGAANVVQGDLERLIGDLVAAEASYERAHELGCEPQPGLALLRLAQGRVDSAAVMIRRVLAETEGPLFRARMLSAYVEIMLAAGDPVAARVASDELREVAVELGMALVRARAHRAAGAALLATGDATAALPELRRAFTGFRDLGVRFEAAGTRLLIAGACRDLGDLDAADMERDAARSELESLRAQPEPRPAETGASSVEGLTNREVEVLLLLVRGKTNRAIAHDLFISEKTVASHVSHIFTKLGVTSRSAATAFAYDHDLV